jgi:hypothetical protein
MSTPTQNWKRIDTAPKGIGDVLLRDGSGPFDPAYVGRQYDDGCWRLGNEQAQSHPTHYCLIPLFDADDGAAA